MPKAKTKKGIDAARPPGEGNATSPASVLNQLLNQKNSPVDIKGMANSFNSLIGGAAGFAKMIHDEYKGTRRGSLARIRILDLMAKLFQIATPKDRVGDTALLSDDDLAAAFYEQTKRKPDAIDHYCI